MTDIAVTPSPEETRVALYERMCSAIAECVRVDEAKDIRDKSLALEAYYRQARNLDAEREAANVRFRAERRVGELLKELARTTPEEKGAAGKVLGGRPDPLSAPVTEGRPAPSPYAATLAEQGMSRQQASRFQAMADIPDEVFEEALASPEKTSTSALLKQNEARNQMRAAGHQMPQVSDEALRLWGQMREFEDDQLLQMDLDHTLTRMTDQMRSDLKRLVPVVATFLTELETACERA